MKYLESVMYLSIALAASLYYRHLLKKKNYEISLVVHSRLIIGIIGFTFLAILLFLTHK